MRFRIVLATMMVAVTTGIVAVISILPAAAQVTPSASRSFDSASVDPGDQVVVTITASNYGQAGGVTETLPTGFSYVSSSLDNSQVTELAGNEVRFTLQGDTSFIYTVTASSRTGTYTFSGTLRDDNRNDHTVEGATRITVHRSGDGGGGTTRVTVPTNRAPGLPGSDNVTHGGAGCGGRDERRKPSHGD